MLSSAERRRDEAGFSLMELSVAVFVLGILLAILFSFVNETTKITSNEARHTRAEGDARVALRTMTEDLRSASVVKPCSGTGYATCVTIDTPRPASTSLTCPASTMTYQLVGTQVKQTRVDYPVGSCSTSTTVHNGRVLMENLENGATPLFSYYDRTGAVIDPVAGAVIDPATGETVLSGSVGSIAVNLVVRHTVNRPVLTLSSMASLRNKRG